MASGKDAKGEKTSKIDAGNEELLGHLFAATVEHEGGRRVWSSAVF
jgi:hypothetical protein